MTLTLETILAKLPIAGTERHDCSAYSSLGTAVTG